MKSSPFLQKTNVYIFINVKDNEYQKFIIGSEAKSETFCVTNTTITLIPEIIPGAEISLQDGTFQTDTCLSLNVS